MARASSARASSARVPSARVLGLVVVVALGLAGAAFVAGRLTSPVEAFPVESSAAAGFARDMQVHHEQGVELSRIIRTQTDDPEIRLLAYDIETSQEQQAGQMFGWLRLWGLPQMGVDPPMTWMSRPAINSDSGHVMGSTLAVPSTMPGYASHEQVAHLKTLRGVAAEAEFLRLMIAHHQGAIEMATSVLDRSHNRVVVELANAVIVTQGAEITYMQQLLDARS